MTQGGRRVAAGDRTDWTGRTFVAEVGAVAHGGHCVARHEGRVVFVRHSLPGEQVLVRVTEDGGGSFCRGDAVEVLRAAPDRRLPRCRYAHPGGCGGCDFHHVTTAGQRALKAAVVREQLLRLAGVDRPIEVESVPGDVDGLGWRRRIRFATAPDGQLGLREHRSHTVIPIAECVIGAPGVGDAAVLGQPPQARPRRPGDETEWEVAVDDRGEVSVVEHSVRHQPKAGRGRAGRTKVDEAQRRVGPEKLEYEVAGRGFRIRVGGFWQTHPGAAEVFTATVVAAAEARPGYRVLELYSGTGLFTASLAVAVGPTGRVFGLEASKAAVSDAAINLGLLPQAEVIARSVSVGAVEQAAAGLASGDPGTTGDIAMPQVDVVVLDPPRTGAGRELMTCLLGLAPRRIVYVACDPAALARDLRTALDAGWELIGLRAFDAFPMTHHVECIAWISAPGQSSGRGPAGFS